MPAYYVDDGGDNSDGSTWAKAYTSINALDAAVALASGDIVYFGHDHNCQAVNSANLTITGPTSGLPCIFISATQGSNPPAYQKGTGAQIDTTEAAYGIILDGSFALYGLRLVSGAQIDLANDADESTWCENCDFVLGANSYITTSGSWGAHEWRNCRIDLTADGTTPRATDVIRGGGGGLLTCRGLTFINAGYRTGSVLGSNSTPSRYIGCDFSGFTNATLCEIVSNAAPTQSVCLFENCKTASTWAPIADGGTVRQCTHYTFTDCGTGSQPTYLFHRETGGQVFSSTAIYRSGGAQVEDTPVSWKVTTEAACSRDWPLYTPWIEGWITDTGSKTFTLHITNDTADFTDREVWLEVEYKGTASSGLFSLATDLPSTRTATAVAQTDDTTSVWTGSGPSYTYMQSLSVTATVNTAGRFRARVGIGVASIGSTRYFHIDPLVTVT